MIRQLRIMRLRKFDSLLCSPVLGETMAFRFGIIIAILTALPGAPSAKAQAGPDPTGIWRTQAGDAKVRIGKCGGGICGGVIWLKEPINPAPGKPQADGKNSNP